MARRADADRGGGELVALRGRLRRPAPEIPGLPEADRAGHLPPRRQTALHRPGGGTGNNALRLLDDPNREVWAVEINETMLRHFRAKLANDCPPDYADRLTIVKDNILRLDALPVPRSTRPSMTNVLYAVRDPECCLCQVNRILKPGGILVLSNPHRETDVDALFDQLQRSLDEQDLFDQFQEHFEAARARHDAMLDPIHRDSIDDIRACSTRRGSRSRESRSRRMSGP